jgi:hypothetical protein
MCVGYPATRGSDCVRSLPDRDLRARACRCRSLVASPWTCAELCHWRSLAGWCAVRACGTPLPPGREYILYFRELQPSVRRANNTAARGAEIRKSPGRAPLPGSVRLRSGKKSEMRKPRKIRKREIKTRARPRAPGRRDDYGEVAPHPRCMQSVVISRADTVGSFMCRGTHIHMTT